MNVPFYRFLEVGLFSFLNLVPFLLPAMYPFRHRLRFSYRVTWVLIGVMVLVHQGLGILAAFFPVSSEAMGLLSTAIYVVFFVLSIKDNIGRIVFVLLVFSNVGNLVTVCAKCMESLLFGSIALEAYRWTMSLCMVFMHALITLPVTLYVRKFFTSSVPINNTTWYYLWCIPGTFYVIWFYHLYFSGDSGLTVALDVGHTAFLAVINLGAFVVYHTTVRLLLEQKKSHELSKSNYLLMLQNVQYDHLQQRIDEARQAKHDVRHHAHLVQEYLRSGKLAELEAYLEQYTNTLPSEQPFVYCGHYETNVLLNYFVQQAQQHHITVDVLVQLPETIRLSGATLAVLLSNLLENAVDACKEITDGEKKITVHGKASNGFVFFDISNTYAGTLIQDKAGNYLTTKEGGKGLGLRSVTHLVQTHGGEMALESENGLFRVSVMLPESSDLPDSEPQALR